MQSQQEETVARDRPRHFSICPDAELLFRTGVFPFSLFHFVPFFSPFLNLCVSLCLSSETKMFRLYCSLFIRHALFYNFHWIRGRVKLLYILFSFFSQENIESCLVTYSLALSIVTVSNDHILYYSNKI